MVEATSFKLPITVCELYWAVMCESQTGRKDPKNLAKPQLGERT